MWSSPRLRGSTIRRTGRGGRDGRYDARMDLPEGAHVVRFVETHPGGGGLRRSGIVLCEWRDEWVTWIAAETAAGWTVAAGRYYDTADDAAAGWRDRVAVRLL